MKEKYSLKKIQGATFTPHELAMFLASEVSQYIQNDNLIVEDPSCGDGSLLEAIASILTPMHKRFSLVGTDTNPEYVSAARNRLTEQYDCDSICITQADFLGERLSDEADQQPLQKVDLFIANPPYVRTQILGTEEAQRIAKAFGLSGRIDLYYPFLINMTERLKEGGLIGVITSNKYLTTKSGSNIRNYLLQNYEILEIIDLGDTKLFDAAVLPAIFIGRKNSHNPSYENALFSTIYESREIKGTPTVRGSVFDVLREKVSGQFSVNGKCYTLSHGSFLPPVEEGGFWGIRTTDEREWLNAIERNTAFLLGDRFPVRVGVKSCADEVFFNRDWRTIPRPEKVFFKSIISQENISRWQVPSNLSEVIYPHYNDNGKKAVYEIERYPQAEAFFRHFEDRLKERKYLLNTSRRWYEYWVPQNPVLWDNPKIVFADISSEPRFVIDTTGSIVNGNCYWITADDIDILYLIIGIANSKVIERYHDICFNNKLYSGKRRYLAQYVEKYPVPNPQSAKSKEIIETTKQLFALESNKGKEKIQLEERLNSLVSEAFGIKD